MRHHVSYQIPNAFQAFRDSASLAQNVRDGKPGGKCWFSTRFLIHFDIILSLSGDPESSFAVKRIKLLMLFMLFWIPTRWPEMTFLHGLQHHVLYQITNAFQAFRPSASLGQNVRDGKPRSKGFTRIHDHRMRLAIWSQTRYQISNSGSNSDFY